jgi:site-specific recombinase XerD
MGRESISGPPRRPKKPRRRKAPDGPRIVERDGYWHVTGTVRVKGESVRLRRSTELAAADENWEDADRIKDDWVAEIKNEVVHGIKPSRPVVIASREYLGIDAEGNFKPDSRFATLGPTQKNIIAEVVAKFGLRVIRQITADEWNKFLNQRHAKNTIETRVRYCAGLFPFLDWCADPDRGYLMARPTIKARPDDKGKGKASRRKSERRRVAELTPELLAFTFSFASIHLRAQLYVEWSTGGRVSSVLFGCTVADLMLTSNRQQLRFRYTKNGDDVIADLHLKAVEVLQEYLKWRGNLHLRTSPLFLTLHRKPYSTKGREAGWGGANKTAFNAMKRRAIRERLRLCVRAHRAGDFAAAAQYRAETRVIRRFTQHWLRHWFATFGLATGMSRQDVMNQGGWLDERSVARYEHDVPDIRRSGVLSLPLMSQKNTAVSGK